MDHSAWIVFAIVGWLGMLPSVAGCIVCLRHLERSRWVALLLGAFAFEVALGLIQRVSAMFLGTVVSSSSANIGLIYAGLAALGLLANAAVVVGIAGLL